MYLRLAVPHAKKPVPRPDLRFQLSEENVGLRMFPAKPHHRKAGRRGLGPSETLVALPYLPKVGTQQ